MANIDDDLSSRLQRTRLTIVRLKREICVCEDEMRASPADSQRNLSHLSYARARLAQEQEIKDALMSKVLKPERML